MLTLLVELFILGLLVLTNGLLAMAETAVVSTRKTRLRKLVRDGDKGAPAAVALAEQPARFLALVEFWLTLSILFVGVLAGARLVGRLAGWLAQWPVLAPHALWISVVTLTLGLASVLLVFGELVPKRVGLAYPEKVASLFARAVRTLSQLASPLLKCFEVTTDFFARLLGVRQRTAAETISDDEVRALIEKGLHAGVFQRAEKEMVDGVLALDQRPVTSIMTPRPSIVFLNVDDPEDVNWRKIVTSGHSYFPVYQANRDQVVGMVAVKALWAHSAIGLPTTLKNLLIPALFVPETMTAIQLLEHFKKSGKHTAIVTDEFGAVQGLVSLIDVMEAIVGDMPERGRNERPEATRREDGSWLVDATLSTNELKTLLAIESPLPDEKVADFQTLGGFVVTQFGRIPAAGDYFDWSGWRFEVVDMDRRRVDKVLVGKAPPPAAPVDGKATTGC